MKKEIIDKLRYSANLLAWIMGQNKGKFDGFGPDNNSLVPKVIDDSTLKFIYNGDEAGAYIMFKDIRPGKISETTYDDPKIISSETKDAYSSVATNLSDTVSMERTYSITEGSESSTQTDIGLSVAVGISQSVSYGGDLYGASGTTELSIDIEASFNQGWTEGKSEERTIETSIEIPPMTKTTITATKARSKLRQKVHFVCDLDYSIEFHNYGVAKFHVESRDVLARAFDGEYFDGLWTVDEGDWGAQNVANAVARGLMDQPKQYKGAALPTFNTEFTKEIKFDKSVTGEVILKSIPMSYTIQAGDGFWSAAGALGIDTLESLFNMNPKFNIDTPLNGGEVFYGYKR